MFDRFGEDTRDSALAMATKREEIMKLIFTPDDIGKTITCDDGFQVEIVGVDEQGSIEVNHRIMGPRWIDRNTTPYVELVKAILKAGDNSYYD
jgi:hypothetical protein